MLVSPAEIISNRGVERLKVLVTGASGLIGGLAIKGLGAKYDFSGLSRRPVPGIPHLAADITQDVAAIQPAFAGIHSVLHLAAGVGPGQTDDWGATMAITVQGTLNVFEAARIAGVKRIVFFSSGAAQLAFVWRPGSVYAKLMDGPDNEIPATWPMVAEDAPVCPINPYGVGKLFGEHLGRYYADKYGISTLVIRCGAVKTLDRPDVRREYPGFFSQADCVQLIDKCLSAPASLKYEVFNGMSENKWRWRDTDHTKKVLGWKPTGSADRFPVPT